MVTVATPLGSILRPRLTRDGEAEGQDQDEDEADHVFSGLPIRTEVLSAM